MSEDTAREKTREERIANARIGYQVAASLEANEVRALWSRFSAMLTANGIIIGVIGWSLNSAIINEKSILLRIPIAMSIFGIFLCALWYLLMARKQRFCEYLMLSARELEQDWLNDPVRTLARGGKLVGDKAIWQKQDEVNIKLGDQPRPIEMHKLERVKTRKVSNLIIALFAILYLSSIIFCFWILYSSGWEDEMDWSQVPNIVLAVFTVVLAGATIALWRSTRRYANATDKLVDVTERYTEATDKMAQSMEHSAENSLKSERIKFMDRLISTYHGGSSPMAREYENILLQVAQEMGIIPEVSTGEESKAVHEILNRVHKNLLRGLLSEIIDDDLEDDI